MAKYGNIYRIEESIDEVSAKYFFVSVGKSDVIKAVEYQYIQSYKGGDLFNLAFGDYDIETEILNDQINTNNGDHYAVLNTVLSTIPVFFENNPQAILMVQGSDNSKEFIDNCRLQCQKKCSNGCRNIMKKIRNMIPYFVKKEILLLYEIQRKQC